MCCGRNRCGSGSGSQASCEHLNLPYSSYRTPTDELCTRPQLTWLSTAFLALGIVIIAAGSPGTAVVRGTIFMVWACVYLVLESSLTLLIAVALWRKRSGLARSDRLLRRIIL